MKPAAGAPAAATPPAASLRTCIPLAAPAGFELWRVDLAQPLSRDELALLDASERARAERFAFDALKQRYRAAHVALRRLLAAPLAADPATLRFAFGAHGKPRLAGCAEAPAFNLSDSGDVALIAIAPGGEIGVDLELLRPIDDAAELAAQHFCRREAEALATAGAATGAKQRDRAFLRVWARKEACLKAIGSGLSIAAASFDGGLLDADASQAPAWTRVTIPTPDGVLAVEVIELDAGPDGVAALARQVRARRA